MTHPRRLVLAGTVLIVTAAPAAADPKVFREKGYAAPSFLIGHAGVGLQGDVGVRVLSAFFVHAHFAFGVPFTNPNDSGSYRQFGAGIEARGSHDGPMHGFAGLDLGYRDQTEFFFHSGDRWEASKGLVIVPRVGVELGRKVRFRLAVALPIIAAREQAPIRPDVTFGLSVAM
jgi:hypothetical protein